jgi:hypothetical protein
MSMPARRWAVGYARAWRARDPKAAVSLCDEEVVATYLGWGP